MTNLALATPSVSIVNNHAITTSKAIAEYFHKLHKNILQSIDNLIADIPEEYRQLNFQPAVDMRKNPSGGEDIQSKIYMITKDGFVLLAMGFTGKKALAFKIAYIQQFNAMEAELSKKEAPQKNSTLSPAMQHYIQTCVSDKAKQDTKAYQTIYSGIKTAFKVGSYKDIPFSQFPALCKHLNVPVALELLEGEYLAHGEQQLAVSELPEIDVREHMVGWIKSNIQLEGDLAALADEKAVALALEFHNLAREHIARKVAYTCVTNASGLDKVKAKAAIKAVTLNGTLTLKFHNAVRHILFMSQAALDLNKQYLSEMEAAISLH